MKKLISTVLCLFILLSCILPAMAATGVPEEVMESTKSVVRILSKYYNGAATGSGFVIKNEPGEVLIATNDHVVEGNPTSISIWVGEDRMVDAEIVFTTSEKDLCVLKVTDTVDMKPLKLSKEEPQHGAAIYVVGYPGAGDILSDTQAHTSESVTITDGIISAIRSFTIEKGGNPVKLLQVNAAINSGNSGGPLFNTEGVVVGVNTYKVNADSQGVFGSVDISELWRLLDQYGIDIPEEPEAVEEVIEESSFLMPVLICAGVVCLVLTVILIAKRRKKNTPQRKSKDPKIQTITLQAHMEKYPQGLGVGGSVSLLLSAAIQLRNFHNDGKLHLQICPENILIGADGASLKDPSSQETGRFNSGFAAPEIYRGAGFGITSDIYSFAAVLLYAATGKVPANSLQQEVLEQDFALLEDVTFAQIIRKAMASNILDRTQSMQELIYSIAVYKAPLQETQAQHKKQVAHTAPKQTVETISAPVIEVSTPVESISKQTAPQKKKRKMFPIVAALACGVLAIVLIWSPADKTAENGENVALQSTDQEETTVPTTAEEIAYAEAEQLLADGETAKAAIAFGKLGDYSDARNRSFALWDEVAERDTICAMGGLNELGTAGLMSDGTVLLTGGASSKFPHRKHHWEAMSNDVDTWTDIIAIASGNSLFGLKADGSVNVAAPNGLWSEVEQWQDIVSISASDYFVLGLKIDGTVQVDSWKSSTDEENDRLAWIPELSKWTDIVAVSAGTYNAVGLRANGTVVVLGEQNREKYWREIEQWQNIITISTGPYGDTLGLKADGTLLSAGGYIANGDWDVSQWRNIVDFSVGWHQVLGVRSDGTVVAAGYNHNGCINVKKWTDIIAVDTDGNASGWHTVGLKSDGTVVAVGDNTYGQCSVQDWTEIAQPGQLTSRLLKAPTDQQAQYDAAEKLLADGEIAKAAIAFGKLAGYEDARQRSFRLWRELTPNQTVCGDYHITAALQENGTVLFAGSGDARQMAAKKWTDIISVSISSSHTVGLKADGTVLAAGYNYNGQCDVSAWREIIAVEAVHPVTIGLKSDGTVLAIGWEENGQCDVEDWKDIVAISASSHTVGLKMDGTVVAVGAKGFDRGQLNVSDWTDIIAISAGNAHTVGLKSDGTVVAVGADYGKNGVSECVTDVKGWTDIIAVAAGSGFTAGLKSDGTVVFAGFDFDQNYKVSEWSDIVSISAGCYQLFGQKADGTLVVTGLNKGKGEFNVTNWTDIKLPAPNYLNLDKAEPNPTAPSADPQSQYAAAETLLAQGETAKAAIAFGKLGTYRDARERSFAAWNKVPNRKTISFDMWNQGPENIVMFHALRKDGTIAVDCRYSETLSDEEIAQYMPSTYKNIVSIHGTIGLRYDGTLSLPGSDFHYYQELMEWSDLVAISVPCNPYDEFFVGLKSDGTVVAVGNNKYGECNVTEWKDIIAIAAGEDCTFGLKSDGTVVATGRNLHGMCEVESWTDIKAISTHDVQTFGLRNDGTVVAIGSNYNGAITRASKLTNIAFIEGMYAFKEDGTSDSFSEEKWNNIVSITYSTEMGGMDIIGLRYDGSFVFSRGNDNSYVRAKAWNDIQLPIISETPITMPVDNASAY